MTTDSESGGGRPDQRRQRRSRRQFEDVNKEFQTEPVDPAEAQRELANEELGDALESRRQTTWGLCAEVAFLRLLAWRSRLLGSGDDDAAWSVVWEQPPHEVLAAIQNEAATYEAAIAEWLPATAKFAESTDEANLAEVVGQKKKNYARSVRDTRRRRAVNARRRPHARALRNILRLVARLLPTFARAAADGRLEAAQTAAGARAVFALGVEAGRQSVMISRADDFERAISDRQREDAAGEATAKKVSRVAILEEPLTAAYLNLSPEDLKTIEAAWAACEAALTAAGVVATETAGKEYVSEATFRQKFLEKLEERIDREVDDASRELVYDWDDEDGGDESASIRLVAQRLQSQYDLSHAPVEAVQELVRRRQTRAARAERDDVIFPPGFDRTAGLSSDAIGLAMRALVESTEELKETSSS